MKVNIKIYREEMPVCPHMRQFKWY